MNQASKITQHPAYQKLVSSRRRFSWLMTFIVLVIYYGFIGLVAFKKELLAAPMGDGVTTWSIPIGIGVIVSTVLLTGLYVRRANAEYDALTLEIKKEFT
jgi:uncharacterized membrane protein (DUF485 family)